MQSIDYSKSFLSLHLLLIIMFLSSSPAWAQTASGNAQDQPAPSGQSETDKLHDFNPEEGSNPNAPVYTGIPDHFWIKVSEYYDNSEKAEMLAKASWNYYFSNLGAADFNAKLKARMDKVEASHNKRVKKLRLQLEARQEKQLNRALRRIERQWKKDNRKTQRQEIKKLKAKFSDQIKAFEKLLADEDEARRHEAEKKRLADIEIWKEERARKSDKNPGHIFFDSKIPTLASPNYIAKEKLDELRADRKEKQNSTKQQDTAEADPIQENVRIRRSALESEQEQDMKTLLDKFAAQLANEQAGRREELLVAQKEERKLFTENQEKKLIERKERNYRDLIVRENREVFKPTAIDEFARFLVYAASKSNRLVRLSPKGKLTVFHGDDQADLRPNLNLPAVDLWMDAAHNKQAQENSSKEEIANAAASYEKLSKKFHFALPESYKLPEKCGQEIIKDIKEEIKEDSKDENKQERQNKGEGERNNDNQAGSTRHKSETIDNACDLKAIIQQHRGQKGSLNIYSTRHSLDRFNRLQSTASQSVLDDETKGMQLFYSNLIDVKTRTDYKGPKGLENCFAQVWMNKELNIIHGQITLTRDNDNEYYYSSACLASAFGFNADVVAEFEAVFREDITSYMPLMISLMQDRRMQSKMTTSRALTILRDILARNE